MNELTWSLLNVNRGVKLLKKTKRLLMSKNKELFSLLIADESGQEPSNVEVAKVP